MLKIKNVTKIFNKDLNPDDLKVALDDVSLDLQNGEFVTVIGSNGSGKSTLLNAICGRVMVDAGTLTLGDENITNLKDYQRAKNIGIVFQDPNLGTAANMSLVENLFVASRRAKRKGLRWGFNKEKSLEFKKDLENLNLGLEDRLNQKMGQFSGGQRQAVTLLMATMVRPKILLLDEHTAALDPKTAKTVLGLTNDIVRREKLTCLMITHNMMDAIKYGDRLLMLDSGKIILDVRGEEKKNLKIEDLIKKFDTIITDEMILA